MDIITRAEIGYRPPKSTSPTARSKASSSTGSVAAGMAQNPSVDAVKRTLRGIQAGEMDRKKEPLPDVSYSFFVDPAGNAYEGRGDAVRQAGVQQLQRPHAVDLLRRRHREFRSPLPRARRWPRCAGSSATKFPACAFVRPALGDPAQADGVPGRRDPCVPQDHLVQLDGG